MKIEKSKAKELFNIAPEWFKKELINEFGEDFFTPKDFRQIKTFEDACKALEISNDSCRPIYDEEGSSDEIAYKKLKVIQVQLTRDGFLIGMIQIKESGSHILFCRPGSVFRIRFAASRIRTRLSVPAFALNQKRRLNMLENNFSVCMKIF
jgi:hypothetical protein